MILIRVSSTLCSKLSLSFEKDWLLWGWHLSGCTTCLFWRSVLQPWQISCGRWSIWIQTTLNHIPLNLMCMGFPGALSAPFQSTGSLPSCIQQSGSRAPWRPDIKHTQAANSFVELLCSVYILSHRNRTVEVKQMYNLQRFWNRTLLLYERTYKILF